MEKYFNSFPTRAKRFYQYALQNDIFFQYQTLEGMELVLHGMSHRASFESNLDSGVNHLKEHLEAYENEFLAFYPELVKAVAVYLKE